MPNNSPTSCLGFGTYRAQGQEAGDALILALQGGIRLFDTAPTYQNRKAAQWLGEALSRAYTKGIVDITDVRVVSKIGVVQGDAWKLIETGVEVVQPHAAYGYSLDPSFLERQFAQHQQDLQAAQITSLLIHNPESLLAAGLPEAEVYKQLYQAFHWLEDKVSSGQIQSYGVASNGLPSGKLQLKNILETARAAARHDHHCRVLQIPLNVYEVDGLPVIAEALAEGMSVLVHRPFNVAYQRRGWRLAEVEHSCSPGRDLQTCLERLAALGAEGESWRQWCLEIERQCLTYAEWSVAYEHRLKTAGADLLPVIQDATQWLVGQALQRHQAYVSRLKPHLQSVVPQTLWEASLSTQVLWPLLGVMGVEAVLTGMHRVGYVEDALGAARGPRASPEMLLKMHQAIREITPVG